MCCQSSAAFINLRRKNCLKMKNYYKILDLKRDASPELIKQRFRELAFEYHPDVSRNPNADEVFIEIYEAYDILSQPERKHNYDLLYDFYLNKAAHHIPDEENAKSDIQNFSESAREKARQKAKVRYRDFIRDLDCFFIPGLKGDGKPYSYPMHRNTGITGGVGPMGSIRSKIIEIPIPRSKKAHLFHRIGFLIKALFLILAILAFTTGVLKDYSLIIRILMPVLIILAGGIIMMMTYRTYKVRSKFLHAGRHPLVIKYRSKGYTRGFHPMISTTPVGLLAWLFRLIL